MYHPAIEQKNWPVIHQRVLLGWSKAGWTADFENCEELPAGLASVLKGWTIEDASSSASTRTSMRFERVDGGYRWEAPDDGFTSETLFGKPETPASAITDFHYMLNGWFVRRFEDMFTLHCAAVRIGDGVVLFPAEHKAGKSLMSVALSARGHRVFGDDVIAIERQSQCVLSLGVLPRVRLPLPPQATSPELRRFVMAHSALADEVQAYIDPGADAMALVGETCRIKAIVHLRRLNRPAAAELAPSSTASALRTLIRQNYSRNVPASELFDDLCSLVRNGTCHELSYHRVEDAVRLLEEKFASNWRGSGQENENARD